MSRRENFELQREVPRSVHKPCGNSGQILRKQTLPKNGFERGGNQEWLHSHVDQPGDRAGRVVRVEGRENQMPGERRLNRDLRCFEVARFTDHDSVGILPQKGAQDSRKVKPMASFTGTCTMPSRSYSTGSSAVSNFESIVLILRRQE